MDPKTGLVDIIEEELGVDLATSSAETFQQLDKPKLLSLSNAIEEATSAPWFELPADSESGIPFAPHRRSGITATLGGIGGEYGMQLPFSANEMSGSAILALTYLPRVAVSEGIQYLLDKFRFQNTPEDAKANIIELLVFYGRCRELIRSGEIVLIPRHQWLKHEVKKDHDIEFDDEKIELLTKQLGSADGTTVSEGADSNKRILLRGKANDVKWKIIQLSWLAEQTGYLPLLSDRYEELAFDAMIEASASRSAARIDRARVLLPSAQNIPVSDFLSAREADCFVEFRRAVDDISRLDPQNLGPISTREVVAERLQQGREDVEESIKKSATLARNLDTVKTCAINTVSGSIVMGMINPDWASNPWKLLIPGLTAGVMNETFNYGIERVKNQDTKHDKKKVAAMFAVLEGS